MQKGNTFVRAEQAKKEGENPPKGGKSERCKENYKNRHRKGRGAGPRMRRKTGKGTRHAGNEVQTAINGLRGGIKNGVSPLVGKGNPPIKKQEAM